MRTILVINDEKNIRSIYEEELKDYVYQGTIAKTIPKALERLNKQTPNLTLDIKTPEMDESNAYVIKSADLRKL
jgi:CheY-like chemotaxis protein